MLNLDKIRQLDSFAKIDGEKKPTSFEGIEFSAQDVAEIFEIFGLIIEFTTVVCLIFIGVTKY
jgi:hypothetical protein